MNYNIHDKQISKAEYGWLLRLMFIFLLVIQGDFFMIMHYEWLIAINGFLRGVLHIKILNIKGDITWIRYNFTVEKRYH